MANLPSPKNRAMGGVEVIISLRTPQLVLVVVDVAILLLPVLATYQPLSDTIVLGKGPYPTSLDS